MIENAIQMISVIDDWYVIDKGTYMRIFGTT
jgi:hypothetical protein